MRLPDLISAPVVTEHSLQLNFVLAKKLFWFKGHFPIQAIFPGVAQIDLVMHYAKEYWQINTFAGVDVIKFQQPLFPEDKVCLDIDWLVEKNKLKFQYRLENTIVSTGQISL